MHAATSPHEPLVQPQVNPRKRGFFGWLRCILLGFLILLVALATTGATYQAVASAHDVRAFPAPGQLVDIDGYKLHIHCVSEGSPTVILEGGSPLISSDWAWVQPEVAKTTPVCAYDRAGLAWSEASPHPRNGMTIAAELHTLLQRVNIPGPYVLAGHSFGGLYVRVFAAQYPTEVAGMVLVDASHPDQWTRLPDGPTAYSSTAHMLRLLSVLTPFGIPRLIAVPPVDPDLPAAQQAELEAVARTTQHAVAARDEFLATPVTDEQVLASTTFGARPLVVLTAPDLGPATAAEQQSWRTMQDELAGLSSNSLHRDVDGANHTSLVHDHRHAQVTSNAIRQVVDAARTGQPLARN
jgi:pimeloyl-ACP methyl ester carboxylesterase